MRFLFNFVFFGILFYLIFLFFPEVFKTLVSWVEHIYAFLKDLVIDLVAKFQGVKESHELKESIDHAEKALLIPSIWFFKK